MPNFITESLALLKIKCRTTADGALFRAFVLQFGNAARNFSERYPADSKCGPAFKSPSSMSAARETYVILALIFRWRNFSVLHKSRTTHVDIDKSPIWNILARTISGPIWRRLPIICSYMVIIWKIS